MNNLISESGDTYPKAKKETPRLETPEGKRSRSKSPFARFFSSRKKSSGESPRPASSPGYYSGNTLPLYICVFDSLPVFCDMS